MLIWPVRAFQQRKRVNNNSKKREPNTCGAGNVVDASAHLTKRGSKINVREKTNKPHKCTEKSWALTRAAAAAKATSSSTADFMPA